MAKLSFISYLFLTGHTLAQNNSTNETCQSTVRDVKNGDFHFNSTGTISVQFDHQDEPWQISVSLTDGRAESLQYPDQWNYKSMQWISLWLSVPESLVGTKKGNETNVCAYMMRGKNATATNATEPQDSCEGIISDGCFEKYEGFDRPMNEVQGGRCPHFRQDGDCESFRTWSGKPTNFSSSTCAVNELENVDLDDNYLTFGSFPAGAFEGGDDEVDSFEAYDLKVRQPIPILFVAHYNGNVSAKMVCIAPNDLVGESRVPQSEDPSGAVVMRVGWTGVLVGVAVLFSVL